MLLFRPCAQSGTIEYIWAGNVRLFVDSGPWSFSHGLHAKNKLCANLILRANSVGQTDGVHSFTAFCCSGSVPQPPAVNKGWLSSCLVVIAIIKRRWQISIDLLISGWVYWSNRIKKVVGYFSNMKDQMTRWNIRDDVIKFKGIIKINKNLLQSMHLVEGTHKSLDPVSKATLKTWPGADPIRIGPKYWTWN